MREKEETRRVDCGSGTIAYTLTRKAVKNINLRIREDGRVLVSANRRVPVSFIDAWIREKQAFIRRAQEKYKNRERTGDERGGESVKKGEKLSAEQMRVFMDAVDETYEKFRARWGEQIPYPKVRFRYMTSRWGSCQPSNGKITLNTRLLDAPEGCLEYVVAHEFAHFIRTDHSKAFWDVVESFLPDWKERRRALREWG